MIKFRSMLDAVDVQGNALPDSKRLTPFGEKLRSSSLDELSGLWNVLKGDMSLVGPRPLLVEYLPLYNDEQAKRHNVRPGITGWAQVNGFRGETDTLEKMEKRIEFDLDYIRNWSLGFDIKIVFLTIPKIFKDKNAH